MITVKPKPEDKPEPDFQIEARDADLIQEIKTKVGGLQAVIVTRWLTKCGLRTAHDFVNKTLK